MSDEHVVRWPRLIGHAAIGLLLASIYVGLPAGTFEANSSNAFQIWIVAAILAFLATGIASYLKQAGRSSGIAMAAAGAVAAVGIVVAVLHGFGTDERWNGPLTEVNGRLEQRLGFSIAKLPPGFTESTQVESQAKVGSDEAVYVFVDRSTASSLELEIRRTQLDGRRAIEELVRQRAGVLTRSGSGHPAAWQITGGGIDGDDANPVGRLQAQGMGHTMRSTYHLLHTHNGTYAIALISLSADPNVLSDVLESYRAD